jgi:hypothetical protein
MFFLRLKPSEKSTHRDNFSGKNLMALDTPIAVIGINPG